VRRAVLAVLFVALGAARAFAQPAEALGKPLVMNDLPNGTVQVKVIKGSVAKPVADTDVHISVGGVDHTLRTNDEGHATLPDVIAGQSITVKIAGEKGDISSETFPMPDSGAVHVMLSNAPMEATPGAAAGPMATGGMDPRAASGKGRTDPTVEAGTLIATVTYDEAPVKGAPLKDPPVGTPVVCVGYSDAHGVTAQVAKVDKEGHATFKGLDVSGGTAYFVMTRIARGPDPAKPIVDRLSTTPPVELGSGGGMRVMLSSEKRDSDKPAVDELTAIEGKSEVPPGKVLISVVGVPEKTGTARLVDAMTGKVVASAPLVVAPTNVAHQTVPFAPDAKLDTGTLGVQLVRELAQGNGVPITGTKLAITSGDAVVAEATTAKDGYAQLDSLPTGKPLVVETTIAGQVVRSDPFTMPDKGGGQVTLAFAWDELRHMTALVDVPDGPTATYYAETTQLAVSKNGPKTFRSEPFQPVPDHGTIIAVVVYPRAFLGFRLRLSAEDDYLAVGGQMTVQNYSWSPLVGGTDGLQIPLPDGFTGAGVGEDQEVAKDEDGFRVLRPVPPYGMTFHMGFSLPIRDQQASWDMPLPIGVYDGYMEVRQWPPSVTVHPPTGMPGLRTADADDHGQKYFIMDGMVLMPIVDGVIPHLQFTIDGLPSPATWKAWAPKVVGLLVVAMVLIAAFIAIAAAVRAGQSRASQAAGRKARIEALYEQLVAIEQTGAGEARREELVAELEELLAAERARAKAP
jgi:hypothetical protein